MKITNHAIPAFLIMVLLAAVVFVPTASAASMIVNTNLDNTTASDGLCTLREAITNANNDSDTTGGDCTAGAPGTDTITFGGNYTITLTSTLPSITDSLIITGKGTGNTIVQASTCNPVTLPGSCAPADWRVFSFTGGTSSLEYMTIRYGNCTGSCSEKPDNGGNIYTSTNLTLKAVNVESGHALVYGGGIFSDDFETVTIQNGSNIGGSGVGNKAVREGGGIYIDDGHTIVDNSTISYNTARGGGGIYNGSGQLDVKNNSLIDKNEAGDRGGGGILFDGYTAGEYTTISFSTISNNVSTGDFGAGIYASDDGGPDSLLTIEYSTISGNVSEDDEGGGVVTYGPTMVISHSAIVDNTSLEDGDAGVGAWAPTTITNSTISGNHAPNATDYNYGAAGLGVYETVVTLYNVTISNNSGGYSGGISDWAYGGSTLNIYNSIIYGNYGSNAPDCYNDTSEISFQNVPSILGDDTHCTKSNDGSVITSDPLLLSLSDNGGPTKTQAIVGTSSPAYNASGGFATSSDQRGYPAVGTRDLGAFEYSSQIFLDVPSTHWAVNYVEAIYYAGLTSGYPDDTYRPENPVTRAEMAVFLLNGMGVSVPPLNDSTPFTDISGHWAEKYIEELYDQGVTGGYPDGTYRPENRVTRAEMAVFLLKGIGVTPPAMDGSDPFTDINLHWAEIFIEELYDQGITGGYPDGTYRPENRVTRAEMAVFLVNTFGIPLP